jgi:D-threonate/D-erythronate kinase
LNSFDTRRLIGVIADDLTGANATGILLTRRGYRTASLTGLDWPTEGLDDHACVVINTESRAVPAQTAYERVTTAAAMLLQHGGRPYGKRIDSTLRGNLGPELEAVLNALGPGSVAVVTGAFPASGRTTRDGNHYVNGVLLAETAVRHDPLCPITESHVPTLLAAQTSLPVAPLPLGVVRSGAQAVADAIADLARQGIRLLCADAETDEDIAALGQGMAASGVTCVAADPGPLTAAYTGAVVPANAKRVLVVAGSVTPVSREQLDRLEQETNTQLVTVDAAALGQGGAVADGEVRRVVDLLAESDPKAPVVGVRTSELLTLPDHEMAERIAAGFAEIAAGALGRLPGISGLYTSGGDITLAVCRRLQAGAIELVSEVMPLAVSGRLVGGLHPGQVILTKGGLVGDTTAAVTCVNHILKAQPGR